MLTELVLAGVTYRTVLTGIHESWSAGQLVGIIGPNGAGKSTLLKLIAGVIEPDLGEVRLDGRVVHAISPKQRARQMAYLPQQVPDDVPFTVAEYVQMGRYAHQTPFFRRGTAAGKPSNWSIVSQSLKRFQLEQLAQVPLDQLSGGERQRTAIARCMAQGSLVLLLDEPISNLDLYYQVQILEHLRRLAGEGHLVVVAIHHLELAAKYCSRLVLLQHGRVYRSGAPADVLTEQALLEVFQIQVKTYPDPFGHTLRFSIL